MYDFTTVPDDVRKKCEALEVKQVAITDMTKKDDMKTSFTHNFKPPVKLDAAFDFLKEKEGNTSQVLFTNFRLVHI